VYNISVMPALRLLLLTFCLFGVWLESAVAAGPSTSGNAEIGFPKPLEEYNDSGTPGVFRKLAGRVKADPVNLLATIIFACAIVHTFLTARFMHIAHHFQTELEHLADQKEQAAPEIEKRRDLLQFWSQFFHFFGEVEAVFGIWLIPLFVVIALMKGWPFLVGYVTSQNAAEPIFVVVIMAIASSRPILRLAERCLAQLATLGRSTPAAWWLSILTFGPLLGSLITEPAAMTICALLLRQKIYALKPGKRLAYATLGLLFVNISVGGTLTHFAAPPVVMVATKWSWDIGYMATNFGWKAIAGIVVANIVYFFLFRSELLNLKVMHVEEKEKRRPIPAQITLVHVLFVVWTVLTSHYPALVVLGFLFFLAFVEATPRHQSVMRLRGPLLVGFFLGSLVIHGGCQTWWIEPVLSGLSKWPLVLGAMLLTAFNDNAAITYLSSLVPGFAPASQYAVVAGAVAGGGLTVIANAPNPAGQSILAASFGKDGVSPGGLAVAALIPTAIMVAALMFLP
jgi:Putative Na+/H+ antiporter